MMTPIELCEKLGFRVVCEGEGRERELHGIYCCDLLSVVMGLSLIHIWVRRRF